MRRASGVAIILCLAACSKREPAAESKQTRPPPRIVHFYAAPPVIAKGEKTLLCYAVENATEVKLDPPEARVSPALSRCVEVTPAKSTRYTLSVPGEQQTVQVTVHAPRAKPGPQLIRLFVSDTRQTKPGAPVTLCYGVMNTVSVKLDPGGQSLKPLERSCLTRTIGETTTFALEATGKDGARESQSIKVEVR